jgi:hypothetical protein
MLTVSCQAKARHPRLADEHKAARIQRYNAMDVSVRTVS